MKCWYAQKFLKFNEDLIIWKAEKGNVTAVLNNQDYVNKSIEL